MSLFTGTREGMAWNVVLQGLDRWSERGEHKQLSSVLPSVRLKWLQTLILVWGLKWDGIKYVNLLFTSKVANGNVGFLCCRFVLNFLGEEGGEVMCSGWRQEIKQQFSSLNIDTCFHLKPPGLASGLQLLLVRKAVALPYVLCHIC